MQATLAWTAPRDWTGVKSGVLRYDGGMLYEQDDATLIGMTLDGDADAFRALVERYRERSYRIAYNVVHDYEDARDLTQMAFVKAYRSLPTFDTRKNFYTWFYRIVVNLCVDHLRKHRQKNVYLEDVGDVAEGATPVEDIGAGETGEQITRALATLPEKYRTLIVLRDIEGMSCLEIAKILKCSYTTVRWRLHRARNMFKQEWKRIQKKSRLS